MNVGYLVGSVVFFLFSLGCIGNTVVDMAQGRYGLTVGNLLPALFVHVGTAVVGVYLLGKVRRVEPHSGNGRQS